MNNTLTLVDLMERDNVTATWFWTHSVSVGPYAERESYDVVFSRDGQPTETGELERPTMFARGIHESVDNSMRNNEGRKIEPDTHETLGNLLADAAEIDNNPTFREWVEYREWSTQPAWEQLAQFEEQTALRDHMRRWLGDAYDEYQAADRD